MAIVKGYIPGFGPSSMPSVSPSGSTASDEAKANWNQAQSLFQRPGPYTPGVVNQLTNRRADQTAAAEAVGIEEARNQAAARGMDPAQAIRQMQQQRQAQNVAFTGDIASQGAIQNFAAETPGRMAAADALLRRQITGQSAPAVTGVGVRDAPRSGGDNTPFQFSTGGVNPFAPRNQPYVNTNGHQAAAPPANTAFSNPPLYSPDYQQAGDTVFDNGSGSGWVQNDSTGRRITIAPKPITKAIQPNTAPVAFSGGYANGKQYGATRMQDF